MKHKQEMNKHHEVKVMSLPFDTIKKQVAPFKHMINFQEDFGRGDDPYRDNVNE